MGKMLSQCKEGQLPTRLWIAPPTKMDQEQLTEEGFYATYGKVGARTEMPGCSLCMGNQARVADNCTVVSTSTRNFPNRLGKGANVYLASAELAAVCAILGKMPTPEEYQKYYAELGKDKANIYKYLNFDKVESYVEAAAEVKRNRFWRLRRPLYLGTAAPYSCSCMAQCHPFVYIRRGESSSVERRLRLVFILAL